MLLRRDRDSMRLGGLPGNTVSVQTGIKMHAPCSLFDNLICDPESAWCSKCSKLNNKEKGRMVKLKSDCSGGVPKFLGQTGNGSVPRGPFWQWGRAYVRGRALRGPGAACSHPHRLGVFPVQKVALCPALHFTLFCRWPLSIGLPYPSLDFIHLSVCLLISLFTPPMPSSFLPLLNVSRALTKD